MDKLCVSKTEDSIKIPSVQRWQSKEVLLQRHLPSKEAGKTAPQVLFEGIKQPAKSHECQ